MFWIIGTEGFFLFLKRICADVIVASIVYMVQKKLQHPMWGKPVGYSGAYAYAERRVGRGAAE